MARVIGISNLLTSARRLWPLLHQGKQCSGFSGELCIRLAKESAELSANGSSGGSARVQVRGTLPAMWPDKVRHPSPRHLHDTLGSCIGRHQLGRHGGQGQSGPASPTSG